MVDFANPEKPTKWTAVPIVIEKIAAPVVTSTDTPVANPDAGSRKTRPPVPGAGKLSGMAVMPAATLAIAVVPAGVNTARPVQLHVPGVKVTEAMSLTTEDVRETREPAGTACEVVSPTRKYPDKLDIFVTFPVNELPARDGLMLASIFIPIEKFLKFVANNRTTRV